MKKRCLQKSDFVWELYALWNSTSSDQLGLEEKLKKSCQRHPYQNGCRHLAENFLGDPKFFASVTWASSSPRKLWKRISEITQRSQDNGAKPYIRNPFFPS